MSEQELTIRSKLNDLRISMDAVAHQIERLLADGNGMGFDELGELQTSMIISQMEMEGDYFAFQAALQELIAGINDADDVAVNEGLVVLKERSELKELDTWEA